MAFEPRIVRPDDLERPDEIVSEGPASGVPDRLAAEDNWLPDELQELAVQLSADAARLADCYSVAPVNHESGRAGLRGRGSRLAAAAVLLASAMFWVAGRGERLEARRGGLVSSAAEISAPGPAGRLAQTEPASESGDLGDQLSRGGQENQEAYVPRSTAVMPAVLLDNLTGPEREGVLDLLEQQALEPTSVSI